MHIETFDSPTETPTPEYSSTFKEVSDIINSKEKLPTIYVAISCYGHSKYIKRAVQSVLDSTYKNCYIVVVEDCGPDRDQVIEEMSSFKDNPRVIFELSEKNMGCWYQFNHIIDKYLQTNNFITFLGADDIEHKYRLSYMIAQFMREDIRPKVVVCSFERIQKDQDVTLEEMENTKTDFSYLPSDAVTFHAAHSLMDPKINHFHIPQIELCGATTMFTKDIWLSGMRFNPPGLNLRVSPGEDSDFNIRCALLVQSTIVFGAKLYYYRQNTGTTICEK